MAEYAEKIEKINIRIVQLLGKEVLSKAWLKTDDKAHHDRRHSCPGHTSPPDGSGWSFQMQTLRNNEHG